MASRSRPMSPNSRRETGRTPLSLISNSTTFSHVDCIRSISNCGIFKKTPLVDGFGDVQVFDAETGQVGDGQAAGVERLAGEFDGARELVGGVLQLAVVEALTGGVGQQEVGGAQDFGIELLFAGTVRPDSGDVRPG